MLKNKKINRLLKGKKTGILLISRMSSRRIKKKAALKILNKTLLEIIILRLQKDFDSNNIYICTANDKFKQFYKSLAKSYNLRIFCGSEEKVLKRIIDCMSKFKLKNFVRVTADNVLIDNFAIKKMLKDHIKNKNDYTFSNSLLPGTESEIFSLKSLKSILKNAVDQTSTEFLSYYYLKSKFKKKCIKFNKSIKDENLYNISVDHKKDFILLKKLINYYKSFFIKKKEIAYFIKKYSKKQKIHTKIPLVTKLYDVRTKSELNNKAKYFMLSK